MRWQMSVGILVQLRHGGEESPTISDGIASSEPTTPTSGR
jgi:hypothetical protein